MTSLCLSFLSVEWAGGAAFVCWVKVDGVRAECTEPSRCLAHSRCSVKWHHWLIHGVACAQGHHLYLYVLIGASVAFILLLGLLVVLLVRHRRQVKGRKPAAAASEDTGLYRSSGPEATTQEETLYAVVRDTQPEDRQQDSQVSSLCFRPGSLLTW